MSRSTVVIELAGDAPLPGELAAGGVFVPGCGLRLAEECDLVVRGASHQLRIPARVVYVDPRGGAGLELLGFSSDMKALLVELASPAELPAPVFEGDADRAFDPAQDEPDEADDPGLDDHALAIPSDEPDEPSEPDDAVAFIDDAAREPDDGDDDLAIPVSDEADYAASIAPAAELARYADAVFAYAKPGLAYRGGVAQGGVARQAGDAGDERDERGFTEALAAELDAELGIGDFADADEEPEPAADHGLELDLIDPATGDALASEGDRDADGAQGSPIDEADYEDDDAGGDGERGGAGGPGTVGPGRAGSRRRFARNVNERLRGLTLAAQVKMATQGELHERIILERLYGKNVWEPLLRNPRLTAPEVSRIARYGSLPRILLEIIVGNNAWLQIPEVRRALLSNPRMGVDQVVKVLRLTPKHELKLAAIQTAYPHAVRNAAKMLMRGDS